MSLKAMIWVMEDAPTEDWGELAVLYALADRANDDGTAAFPSQSWIADRARCTDRGVRNILKRLEGRGIIAKGDPRLVEYIRADRRPTVWNLDLSLKRQEQPFRGELDSGRNGTAPRPERESATAGTKRPYDRNTGSDEPSLTPLEPSLNRPTSKPTKFDEQTFLEFWRLYPRKTNKKEAKTAYVKQLAITDSETLQTTVENFRADSEGEDKQFIPYPSTWLNQERWRDYLTEPVKRERMLDTIEKPF